MRRSPGAFGDYDSTGAGCRGRGARPGTSIEMVWGPRYALPWHEARSEEDGRDKRHARRRFNQKKVRGGRRGASHQAQHGRQMEIENDPTDRERC